MIQALIDYKFCPFCSSGLNIRIEENKPLKYCSKCRWTYYPTPHIAVGGIATIFKEADHVPYVLMVKRNREPFKNTWMFPAGFLELGEHPEETLVREIYEETRLRVVRSSFYRVKKSINDPRSKAHLILFYRIDVAGNLANNDLDENSLVEWKSIRDDIDIGFPHHKDIWDEIKLGYEIGSPKKGEKQ